MNCFHHLKIIAFYNADNSKSKSLLFMKDGFVELIVGLRIMHLILIKQGGFVECLQMFLDFGMDMLTADDDTVGIINGCLGKVDIIGFLKILEVFRDVPRKGVLDADAPVVCNGYDKTFFHT